MIAVNEQVEQYLAAFHELEPDLSTQGPRWLAQLRRRAIEQFANLGFPTTRNEDWKYTSVSAIANGSWELAEPVADNTIADRLVALALANLGCSRLVFVNGHYASDLSEIGNLPKGVKAGNLREAFAHGSAELERHYARYAATENQAFVALNTALAQDGAMIEIARGAAIEKPIYVLHVTVTNGQPVITHPRTVVIAAPESEATVVEGFLALGEGTYVTNSVSEIAADENARVDYIKVQQENSKAYHVGTVQAHLARSSRVHTLTVALGSRLEREDVNAVLNGEGAEAQVNGLYMATGDQHVDNHTCIDHAKPHCDSRELYKGILDGKSTGVFNGKIIVRLDAQKTDSKQSNKNLLLSDDAVINTKPQLEIFADDVKCTHGATVGQIDADSVFYLRSRGIALEDARRILTYAFAADVTGRIQYEPLRLRLRDALFARFSGGQHAEEV